MKKIVAFLVVVCMVLSIVAVGCGPTQTSEAPASQAPASEAPSSEAPSSQAPADGEKYKILVMPKLVGIPYFNAAEIGAKEAGEALGVEVIYDGPTEADAAQQVSMITDYINSGVDAICIGPNDPSAVANVLKQAKEKGIVVVDWDTAADPELVDASIRQIDDKEFGELMVDMLVANMGTDDADIAILTGGLNADNLNTWIKYGQEHMAAKYPNLRVVTDKIPTDEDAQKAYSATLDLLKAYPEVKGILGYSTPTPLGAAQAIREKGLQGKVAVCGDGMPEDMAPYLEDGSAASNLLWDVEKLGYYTVVVANAVLQGKTIENGTMMDGWDEPLVVQEGTKNCVMGKPLASGSPKWPQIENLDEYK